MCHYNQVLSEAQEGYSDFHNTILLLQHAFNFFFCMFSTTQIVLLLNSTTLCDLQNYNLDLCCVAINLKVFIKSPDLNFWWLYLSIVGALHMHNLFDSNQCGPSLCMIYLRSFTALQSLHFVSYLISRRCLPLLW